MELDFKSAYISLGVGQDTTYTHRKNAKSVEVSLDSCTLTPTHGDITQQSYSSCRAVGGAESDQGKWREGQSASKCWDHPAVAPFITTQR